ncbi:hypothetical protein BO94DRAFT_582021 [Aspergillus sclerotioniger CBS 115572]|uniref:Uncharacterized protein n=1 Tax=Aspergillus sclerotioniger CBS 115572 TaxID=1450535 RepID=A0A317XAH6_9EURO|nr:hypothetical protein BO94DRAFT_582021 [Aspergillus sclerotioniger CBS 115572]PWY94632.1 hypothetical protein BO94DRAFT_582021 [Aspergillus sclerotioniger CBS 115572]
MKSVLSKATLLALPTLALSSPLVSYAGYYFTNCTSPSVTATNVAASYCVNVENIPIKSFTAYVFSGACDDSTTPVLNTYTEAGCAADSLFETVDVDSEKQCFEADVTLVSLGVECV